MMTAQKVMNVLLVMAKRYGANMNPPNGIIKFILPKEDKDNPAGKDMEIEIDMLNNSAKMSDIKFAAHDKAQ